MKKLRRIISILIVLVLFIGLLPMNLGVVKAEEALDDSFKLKDIRARAYDGDKWEDLTLNAVVFNEEKKEYEEFTTEFKSDIRKYRIYLDPKYEKIQFNIKKNSVEQKFGATYADDNYKVDANDNGDIVTIRPGISVLSVTVNNNIHAEYLVLINKTGNGTIHELNVTDGSAEFYEAYEGDLVTITAMKKNKMVFDRWVIVEGKNIKEIKNDNPIIKEPDKTPTELIMPNTILTIKPTFKESIVSDSSLRNIVLYGLEDEVWKNQKSKLAFKKGQKAYTVDLSEDFNKGYVYVQFGESEQSISVTLNDNVVALDKKSNGCETEKIALNNGENIFKITVTSQDGTNKSEYTLIVNRGEVKYKVRFNPGDGSGTMEAKEIAKGSTYNLPECTFTAPANKEFKAWSVDGKEKAVGDPITVNENTEVIALWKNIMVSVSFNPGEGSGSMDPVEIAKGKEFKLPECKFTAPAGKEFARWQIGEEIKKPSEKITIDGETLITAIWQEKPNPDKPNPDDTNPDKPKQKHSINIIESPYGEVIIDPPEAKMGDRVSVHAIAHYGYELISLSTQDASGKLLPIINGEFIMPDSEVSISPIFREIAPYIEPEKDDKAEREEQQRRHRRDYYHEEENNEDEIKTIDKAQEEKQKESKVLITIGSEILDKVDNGVRTLKAMDTKPYIKGGRTMLPLRYVAEALGYRVAWLSETRTAVIMDIGLRVEIPVDSNFIIANGVKYTSDVKPDMRNNRIMLPIANIARALGLKDGEDILWDEVNRQVTLIRNFNTK